jgi:hypothetical protein
MDELAEFCARVLGRRDEAIPAAEQAHAAMLEASVCYRAWRAQADERPGVDRCQSANGSAAGQ